MEMKIQVVPERFAIPYKQREPTPAQRITCTT
jgi:hypothetical protein